MSGRGFVFLLATAVVFLLFVLPRLRLRAIQNRVLDSIHDPDAQRPILHPESEFVVSFDGDLLIHRRPDGTTEEFPWSDLEKISILTNSDGPFAPDVFWVFHASGDTGACIPQGAAGDRELLERMQSLPGFDNDQFIAAQGSTSEAIFEVWSRSTEPS